MKTSTPPGTNESNTYSDEVLNASWLPQFVLLTLGLNTPATLSTQRSPIDDPDSFLQRIYRFQE